MTWIWEPNLTESRARLHIQYNVVLNLDISWISCFSRNFSLQSLSSARLSPQWVTLRFYMYTINEHSLPPYCFKQDGFLRIPCCPFAFCPLQHITQRIQATRSHNLTLSIPVVNTYIQQHQSTVKVALHGREIKVTTNHNGVGKVNLSKCTCM